MVKRTELILVSKCLVCTSFDLWNSVLLHDNYFSLDCTNYYLYLWRSCQQSVVTSRELVLVLTLWYVGSKFNVSKTSYSGKHFSLVYTCITKNPPYLHPLTHISLLILLMFYFWEGLHRLVPGYIYLLSSETLHYLYRDLIIFPRLEKRAV